MILACSRIDPLFKNFQFSMLSLDFVLTSGKQGVKKSITSGEGCRRLLAAVLIAV